MTEEQQAPTQPNDANRAPVPPTGPAEEPDAAASLQREIEELRTREQELLALAQRVQADFINYRRRIEQERAEQARADRAAIVRSILPVVDDFERAVGAVPPDLADCDWVKGVGLILRKLQTTLEAQGVTPIEALGQDFNPWEHEAVLAEDAGPEQSGKVVGVLREGYKIDGRVIRPAQVKVGA